MKLKRFALPLFAVALVSITFTFQGSASSGKKEVTFTKDVAPIFYKNCVECHRAGDIAPMSLVSYKESRAWARSIKEKVVTREMPPWSPDPHYGNFTNDKRMSQQDIDTIVAWVDGGAKEGDVKDMPKLPDFASGGWQIGKPDVVLQMAEEYTIEPSAPDNYINFFIPTNFKEDVWVQAAEIKPGNKKVVHHVIAFVQTPEMIAAMKAQQSAGANARRRSMEQASIFYKDGTLMRVKSDAEVIDNGCGHPSGGSVFKRATAGEGGDVFGNLLAGYAPGKGVDAWPQGFAKRVPAGSVIMFQVHYSSFKGALAGPEKDRTSIGIIFAKKPPQNALRTMGIQNHYFKIPAGDGAHEVTACYTFDQDVKLTSYMPHMHLRGKDMKYDVIYPDGKTETLLWVPKFSFNWQAMYYLKKPVFLPKGTKFIVTAHFDNSTKNKYNPDPAKEVRWGDPTYDEMMIGWFDYYLDNTAKPDKPDAARASGK